MMEMSYLGFHDDSEILTKASRLTETALEKSIELMLSGEFRSLPDQRINIPS